MSCKELRKIIDFERCFWDVKEINESKEIYEELFDKNLLTYSPLGSSFGYDSLRNTYMQWLEGFPDITIQNYKFSEVDNIIFWEWEASCSHAGMFCGLEPTGKKTSYTGKTIYQFNGNKIINYTCYMDMINIYNQLGFFLQKEEYEGQNILKKNYNLLAARLVELTQYNNVTLTNKELEILSCWLFGHSLKSISALYNISPRTVETHIEHIKYKLLCNSKYDLQNLIHAKGIDHLFSDLYFLVMKKTKQIGAVKSL